MSEENKATEGLEKVANLYCEAFPDARFTARWSIRGAYCGGFMDRRRPPAGSGHLVSWGGIP